MTGVLRKHKCNKLLFWKWKLVRKKPWLLVWTKGQTTSTWNYTQQQIDVINLTNINIVVADLYYSLTKLCSLFKLLLLYLTSNLIITCPCLYGFYAINRKLLGFRSVSVCVSPLEPTTLRDELSTINFSLFLHSYWQQHYPLELYYIFIYIREIRMDIYFLSFVKKIKKKLNFQFLYKNEKN